MGANEAGKIIGTYEAGKIMGAYEAGKIIGTYEAGKTIYLLFMHVTQAGTLSKRNRSSNQKLFGTQIPSKTTSLDTATNPVRHPLGVSLDATPGYLVFQEHMHRTHVSSTTIELI